MKKMIKKISAAVFLALLCLAWLPLNASASEKTEVKISLSVNLTGEEPIKSENYTFRLTPESSRTPMPEGCKGSCRGKVAVGHIPYGWRKITYVSVAGLDGRPYATRTHGGHFASAVTYERSGG